FRGPRPQITSVNRQVAYDQPLTVDTPDAADISSVVLMRNQSATHLVDGDQRSVVLPIVSRNGNSVTVSVPGNRVLPPGPYLLFVNKKSPKGEIPSIARQTYVGGPVPAALADRLQ
ncbi:MAG: DUF1929 domain-containing protein, partial [Actinobacteria bacterium]|nr:DUF1929 domain-containing protein [Actinomycetota bacterium]